MSIYQQLAIAPNELIVSGNPFAGASINTHVDALSQINLMILTQPASDPVNIIETGFHIPFTRYESSALPAHQQVEYPTPMDYLRSNPEWEDREYRKAYAIAAVEQGVAWQIRINRELRKMSQDELAEAMGTHQSAISRMENPEYGKYSIPMLLKAADAFDCALFVKLVPYSALAYESEFLSEEDQYAPGYTEEMSGEQ
jgi:predicted XRE-type DNA-binding protein